MCTSHMSRTALAAGIHTGKLILNGGLRPPLLPDGDLPLEARDLNFAGTGRSAACSGREPRMSVRRADRGMRAWQRRDLRLKIGPRDLC